jgi:hypothetical protein
MRECCVLFLVVAGASCASTSSSRGPDVPAPSERTIAVDDQQVYRATVIANAKAPVPAPPNKTFDAVKAVYEELGVPPGTNDPATGRFGNTDFWKSRRFANEPISAFLNCGDSFSGPIANNYRIYISLLSIVRPDGKGGSELETAFTASAQNMEGASGDRISCGSTGKLEERIRKGVLLKIGSGASQ